VYDVKGTRALVQQQLPGLLWSDAAAVAREGFEAVMSGTIDARAGPRQSADLDAVTAAAAVGARRDLTADGATLPKERLTRCYT